MRSMEPKPPDRTGFADGGVATGSLLSLLGLLVVAGLLLAAWLETPPPSVLLMVVPAGLLGIGLLIVGLQTARGEVISPRDAGRLIGWTLLGLVFFSASGGWLYGLELVTGRSIPFLWTTTVSIGTLGAFVGMVVGLYDANQRTQARTLQEREAKLCEQNDRLEDLTTIVSHDLRNPLNVAMGRLELADETLESEEAAEHLEAVTKSLDRMETLIEDLVTMARKGEDVEALEPVALDGVVVRAWDQVETESATLECRANGHVLADESRLSELLENLIDNAVTHGGRDVTVRVADLDDGFALEDDGPGIPPDERSAVFEAGHSKDPEGTGLGLYIVDLIASAHDWSVDLTEGSDGGARFEIRGVDRRSTDGHGRDPLARETTGRSSRSEPMTS